MESVLRSIFCKRLITVSLIAFALLFCACGKKDEAPSETINVSEEPTATAAEPTPTPTPEPTEEPIPYLGVECGKYQSTFTCEETNQWLDYWVIVPENAVENMPLIVFLHGDGLSNRMDMLSEVNIAAKTKEIYGDNFPFILLMPNNRFPEWYKDGVGTTVKALIDEVADQYKVNKEKIILTGHSRGAVAVWAMVSEYGTYFSCAVPVSCGAEKIHGENFIGVPVRGLCGGWGGDEFYYEEMRSFVRIVNESGGQAELIRMGEYDHGGMGEGAYTKETFDWMLDQ